MKNLRKQLKKLAVYQDFKQKKYHERKSVLQENLMIAKLRTANRKHFSL